MDIVLRVRTGFAAGCFPRTGGNPVRYRLWLIGPGGPRVGGRSALERGCRRYA